jgi:hypothetical protein
VKLSYSKYSTWKKCARLFKYKNIDGLEEPRTSGAMSRGTEIHQTVEDYLLGKSEQLHPEIHAYYGQFMFNLREAGAIPELKIEVDRDWKLVDWDAPEGAVRSVIDAHIPPDEGGTVRVYEWKTGKMYGDHYDQRELYAVKMMCKYPEAKMVEVTGVYFDLKKNSNTYTHPHYYQPLKVEHWDGKFLQIRRDEEFVPNPSYGCRFCHFRKDNGGPCEF